MSPDIPPDIPTDMTLTPRHSFRRFPVLVTFALVTAGLLLSACGEPGGGSADSQVIAQVNGSEISMLQFDSALRRVGVTAPNVALRKEISEKLVERELAMQEALANKFDRQPDVMLKLEEARRDVLAAAWAERIAADAARPTDTQIGRYYTDHPALFDQRKIYRLREAALPADLPVMEEVKRRFSQRQPMPEVIAWLRQNKQAFNEQVVIRAAEQLPIESLARLNAAAEGETVLFESARGVMAYQVISVQLAPVNFETAKPIISDYLRKQAGKKAVLAEMQRVRGRSEISYLGEFSTLMQTPVVTPATAPATASATASANTPTTTPSR
jgi:EpsD family peptidyl-prolyl cis-trans isomerase